MLSVVMELSLSSPAGLRVLPSEHTGIGVLTLAGSSGRIDADRARLFARYGAIAESIQWFGGVGQNAGPWEIPVELFKERLTAGQYLTYRCWRTGGQAATRRAIDPSTSCRAGLTRTQSTLRLFRWSGSGSWF